MLHDLGRLVRNRREQLGWSQSDLARAIGSSPSRMSKLEAGDRSVAAALKLRALEAMGAPLRIEIDAERDPLSDPTWSDRERRMFGQRLLRRRRAERIAEAHAVDAGDVEHALFNLTLPPWRRLARSFQRAGLGRLSTQ